MTKLLISFSLILFHLVANCQSVKLDNLTIWNNLYPNNNNFDKEKRLIRKEKKGGGESVYRTKISNIFYY